MSHTGVYLYWIPLGAGGTGFVSLNGRIYERLVARRQRRPALDLYHTALEVRLSAARFVVETMWPRPDRGTATRGVLVEGAVFSEVLGFTRLFRYEVRRWRDGLLPDADHAVGGARLVLAGVEPAVRLLDLVERVPPLTWGRDPTGSGDMWNSNSVVSWLLTMGGADMSDTLPPPHGRAPGWGAGVEVARMALDRDAGRIVYRAGRPTRFDR